MKILRKIAYLISISLTITSCSLNEQPYGFLSSDEFYQSSNDAYSALAYCYDALPNIELYSRYLYYAESLGTEEFTLKPDAQVEDHELDLWTTTPSNPDLEAVFTNSYIGINRSNALLSNIDGIQMDANDKNEYTGEAYFLRALHYFNLVRLFGSVPMRTQPVTSASELPVPLSPMSDIYALIESDLTKADSLMDYTVRDGRANKVAAEALLSKVYLQLASATASGVPSYDFISDPDSYYTKAAQYAAKVLDNQTSYTFWTGSLPALWDVDNEIGNEFIFSVAVHVDGAKEEGDYSKLSMLLVPYIDGAAISFGPNYSITIRDGWNHMQTTSAFYNSFDPTDLRKTELIIDTVKLADGSKRYYPGGGMEYPFTLKYIDKNQGTTSDQSQHYIPVLRFSDIALVYAEAAGPTAEAYSWVNKIRERAGLPDLTPGLSETDFRQKVLDERSYELAFEGNRLYDLRRTHNIEKVLHDKYGMSITDNQTEAYFYDIPQREIDNNPALTQ